MMTGETLCADPQYSSIEFPNALLQFIYCGETTFLNLIHFACSISLLMHASGSGKKNVTLLIIIKIADSGFEMWKEDLLKR